jgi:putative ABC transport system permease protein
MARYRARSGSALAAISIGVLIAVIISLVAAARYGNVLDYAGPNLTSNQVVLYVNTPPPIGSETIAPGQAPALVTSVPKTISVAQSEKGAKAIATALGATHFITLETTAANLQHAGAGRNWSGQIYVGTPQLLKAFGISPSQVDSGADFLSMRPGLPGTS